MPRQSNSRQIPINELLARRPPPRKILNEEEELQRVLELSKLDHLNHQKKLFDQFSKQASSSSVTLTSKPASASKTMSSLTVYPPKPKKRRLIMKEDEDEEDWFQPTLLLSKSKHKAASKEPPPPVVKQESKMNQITFEYNGDDTSSEGEQEEDSSVHIEVDNEYNMEENERNSEHSIGHTEESTMYIDSGLECIENKETQMISDSDSDCSIIDLVNEPTNNPMPSVAHNDFVLPFVNIHQQPQGQANPYLN